MYDDAFIKKLACLTYAVHRAYCEAIGDDNAQPVWWQASDEVKAQAIADVRCILENPDAPPSTTKDHLSQAAVRTAVSQFWTF